MVAWLPCGALFEIGLVVHHLTFFPFFQRRKQLTEEMRLAREGPCQEDKELARKKLALECSTRAIR
jgi:hypothetical protein